MKNDPETFIKAYVTFLGVGSILVAIAAFVLWILSLFGIDTSFCFMCKP